MSLTRNGVGVVLLLALGGCCSHAVRDEAGAARAFEGGGPTVREGARHPTGRSRDGLLEPVDAIVGAAASAPAPFPGTFTMRVKSSGRVGPTVYLNSEVDYRDQRCLTLALSPAASARILELYGKPAEDAFIDKRVIVEGAAARVTIMFTDPQGRPSGKYYYQTHVRVDSAEQLRIVDF